LLHQVGTSRHFLHGRFEISNHFIFAISLVTVILYISINT